MSKPNLPDLPKPTIEGSVVHPKYKIAYFAPVHFTADQMTAYAEEAVRQALAVQGWMRIETAPEGTILLFCNMNSSDVKSWAFVDWIVADQFCGNRHHRATHWMPLPAPPKENSHVEGADSEPA